MESPEDIEKALARLVPSAISDQGQRSLEDLIDSLAAGETAVVEMPSPRRKPWGWMAGGAGAAAAAVTLALLVPGVEDAAAGQDRHDQAEEGAHVVPLAEVYWTESPCRLMAAALGLKISM